MENTISDSFGKNYIQRLSRVYSILWKRKYGISPTISFPAFGKIFKELSENYNEYQIAFLLTIFFDWSGANGDDDFTRKRLENKTHNIFLISGELDSMRAYVRNVLKIDLDDVDEIKPSVDKLLVE